MTSLKRSKILAFASHFPSHVVTNHDLEKLVNTSDEWIRERTGIQERRILQAGETNSDLAVAAAKKVLEKTEKSPLDIDLIISCSNTPDKYLPAMACVIQNKLGAHNSCGAFDITAACAGWVVGLNVADQFIKTGKYKTILLIGSEALSRFTNWKDRNTCVLFGDGAGAALITESLPGDKSELLSVSIHSDGRHGDLLMQPEGGSETPFSAQTLENAGQYFVMNGSEVFKHAVRSMSTVAEEVLKENNVTTDQVSWFIPHQANLRIIEGVAKKLSFPMDRVAINLERYGNTSAATIPSAADEYIETGKIKRGDLVLVTSFGGGFTWAGALFRW